jgi:chromosome segregation and condensation protein ScpB
MKWFCAVLIQRGADYGVTDSFCSVFGVPSDWEREDKNAGKQQAMFQRDGLSSHCLGMIVL